MKKKFKIIVKYDKYEEWMIDCDYLSVYGGGITFKKALKSFIVDLKDTRKFYKEIKKVDLLDSEIKMKKRFKKLEYK